MNPVISQTDFPGLKLRGRGKVRDIYEVGDKLLIVATDRLSAFDVVLPTPIPDSLGQCLDWAKRGWVFATSSYRGESVNITSSSPEFPSSTWTSTAPSRFRRHGATGFGTMNA